MVGGGATDQSSVLQGMAAAPPESKKDSNLPVWVLYRLATLADEECWRIVRAPEWAESLAMCGRARLGPGFAVAADATFVGQVRPRSADVVAGADSAATALRLFCSIVHGDALCLGDVGTGADSVCSEEFLLNVQLM